MTTPNTPRKRGRKPKYSPEVVKDITDALRLGAKIKDACKYAGVDEGTYFRWINEKEEFRELTQKALATATIRLVGRISKAADDGDWRAALALLERRDPEGWGRRVVENKHSGTVNWQQVVLEAMQVANVDDNESD